jgi:hypothetical protein
MWCVVFLRWIQNQRKWTESAKNPVGEDVRKSGRRFRSNCRLFLAWEYLLSLRREWHIQRPLKRISVGISPFLNWIWVRNLYRNWIFLLDANFPEHNLRRHITPACLRCTRRASTATRLLYLPTSTIKLGHSWQAVWCAKWLRPRGGDSCHECPAWTCAPVSGAFFFIINLRWTSCASWPFIFLSFPPPGVLQGN